MGSRSARFTLLLVITLVFCSLTPIISVIGFLNFFLCRVFYTYLFVFSEVRKPDLGGVFFFESMKHVQQGLFLYVALMTGVLMERASSLYPAGIAFLCLLYSVSEYRYFLREFRWELLEFHELKGEGSKLLRGVSYRQPELGPLPPEEPPEPPPSHGPQGSPQAFLQAAQAATQALQSQIGTLSVAVSGALGCSGAAAADGGGSSGPPTTGDRAPALDGGRAPPGGPVRVDRAQDKA